MFNVVEMFDSIVDNWRGELVVALENDQDVEIQMTMSPEAYVALRNDMFINTGEVVRDEFHDIKIVLDTFLIGIKNMHAAIVPISVDPYNKHCKKVDV